jgi:hypothetical protein
LERLSARQPLIKRKAPDISRDSNITLIYRH